MSWDVYMNIRIPSISIPSFPNMSDGIERGRSVRIIYTHGAGLYQLLILTFDRQCEGLGRKDRFRVWLLRLFCIGGEKYDC